MGIRFYALIIGIACAFHAYGDASDAGREKRADITSHITYVKEGFRTDPELQALYDLIDNEELTTAQQKATKIIERESTSFSSAKYENYLKAQAYFLRGEVAAQRGDENAALDDMKHATDLGHPYAPYQVASRLVIQSTRTQDALKRQRYLDEAHEYHLMGAELGDSVCIDHIQVALRAKQQLMDEHYWFLLERMGDDAEQIDKFVSFYSEVFNENDRALLDDVMETLSLSKGQKESAVQDVPGRSTLVSAYVDLLMRRQLGFVWKAFFQEDKGEGAFPLQEVFESYQSAIRENPLADLYLLVNLKYDYGAKAKGLAAEELAANALPGDQIVIRCGRLSHYANVWAIDKSKNEMYLLDPFDEFWQPSHNRCVTMFERKPYKYKRHLIRVSYAEVQKMLVAVLAVRDRVL